jgi:hypothetical protein
MCMCCLPFLGLVGLLIAKGQNSGDTVRLAGEVTKYLLKISNENQRRQAGRETTRVVCPKYQKTPFSLPTSAVSAVRSSACFVFVFVLLPPLRCFVLKFGSEMCVFFSFAVAANSYQLRCRRRRRLRLFFSPFHLPTTHSVL